MSPKKKKPLTRKEKDRLDFITGFIKQFQIAPTFEEIALHFAPKTPSVGNEHRYVTSLCAKGYLKKGADRHFAIEVVK